MMLNKNLCIILLVTVFLLIKKLVWAANWVEITQSINGSILYLDLDSIYEGKNNNIFYWQKTVHKNIKNTSGETFIVQGKRVWYSKSLKAENCRDGLFSGLYQYALYGLQDQLLENSFSNPIISKPIPDTVGYTMHKTVCEYYKKLTENTEVEPTKDSNRWYQVLDLETLKAYADIKSIIACSSIYGSTCMPSGNKDNIIGYKFWLKVFELKTNKNSTLQHIVNCREKTFNGGVIKPESPEEIVYFNFCK